jgi:hypothetical protein
LTLSLPPDPGNLQIRCITRRYDPLSAAFWQGERGAGKPIGARRAPMA